MRRYLRRVPSATDGGPTQLLGSDFRLVDSTYLVYLSIDGTLSATRFVSRDSLTVGKSVALVPSVRRNQYSASGQFDLTAAGTLVYVPGINAEVGRLVRNAGDGRATPLNIEQAVHLRFAASPDGRRFGTVVEGIQQQELRIYDLATGTFETVDRGFMLGTPTWSPDGRKIAYRKQEFATPDTETVYLRQLDSPDAPRALVRGPYAAREAGSYLAENFLLLSANRKGARNLLVDPSVTPARVDTLPLDSYFVAISPDRRWIAYTVGGARGLWLQPWPARDRRYLVDANGNEPLWRSAQELTYTAATGGAILTKATIIDPAAASPVGPTRVFFDDPRYLETPGWSIARMPNGDVVYAQSTLEMLGYYVRVVPNWVRDMKRAVDAANR